MLTRKTHAKVYQQELSKSECDKLEELAGQKATSVHEVLLKALGEYLQHWQPGTDVDVEGVATADGSMRLYLWIPYDRYDELCRETRKRGLYVQELVLEALGRYAERHPRISNSGM
ncbi:MAG: hypothetical protein ACLFVT_05520 [Syntrophobacteria bacterium]